MKQEIQELVDKWEKTGLLRRYSQKNKIRMAKFLEAKAQKLIKESKL